jgi:hypothetical protein
VSVNSNGQEGNQHSHASAISADGTLIAFDSAATNLAGNKCDNGFNHIFVHDLTAGTTTCVSLRTNGDEGNGDSFDPSVSADGRLSSSSRRRPISRRAVAMATRTFYRARLNDRRNQLRFREQ